jgi:hypothetical protein
LTGWAGFFAVAYYPVIFTLAGARLISSVDPWPMAGVLFVVALATSHSSVPAFGRKISFLLTMAYFVALVACSVSIALAYLGSLDIALSLMIVSAIAGAATGVILGTDKAGRQRRGIVPLLFAVSMLLVLTMTVVIVPDAVNGVIPAGSIPSAASLAIGVPIYVGAYQNAAQAHAFGARVTVDMRGTNASSIENGNFLAAGLGIHSAGCCVDGIDYAYRFDLYLFHGGNESLVASGWEACDDNAACGGHSWKILLYSKAASLSPTATNVTLIMKWVGGSVYWSYLAKGRQPVNFTSFSVPTQENHDFNTGVSGGVSLSSQKAAYFFQFGVMSLHPVERGGWRIVLTCPATLWNSTWACVQHANSLRGADSYWKVIWRWGEDYPGVSVKPEGKGSIAFETSAFEPTTSFQPLW